MLLAVLIAVLATSAGILAWYLATLLGGDIDTVTVTGGLSYSTDGSTWGSVGAGLTNFPLGATVYARAETTGSGYAGLVNVTWRLMQNGVDLYVLEDYTQVILNGTAGDFIYCTPTGSGGPGFDFGAQITVPGTYTIAADFETP